jgi:hypothetical protein
VLEYSRYSCGMPFLSMNSCIRRAWAYSRESEGEVQNQTRG